MVGLEDAAMRTLVQIAADLAKLPNDDTPEFVYRRCKQIAAELRDFSDENGKQLFTLCDTLDRIAKAYPSVAGPNTCPPPPHGCDKCEIYFLLEQAGFPVENPG